MATQNLPTRQATIKSNLTDDEDAIPDEDASEVTRLFNERLQAWKHACGYLEDYITATEKMQEAHGKEYNKVLKTVSNPLREGHHFDQNLGGIAGMFENIRANTQAISNSHVETGKALKGSVLPIFTRLHAEIKNKNKELTKGAGKGSKAVDKARAATQKHIELLGSHTALHESTGVKEAAYDPYVLQRQIYYRLNKQVQEENSNRKDMLAVQNQFASFEGHVISTMQQGLNEFARVVTQQSEQQKIFYGDIVEKSSVIPLDFEWNGFVQRNTNTLIDPNAPPRSVNTISFPNQDHFATQPMIAGSLQKKGKMLKKYDTFFYVVSQSKFLHEFKSDDGFQKDPAPETSLYLPECVVGAIDGPKFNVKGKDVSKGKIGNKMSITHEYQFKAHTAADAAKWWDVVRTCAGQITQEKPSESEPPSPTDSRKVTPASTFHHTEGSEAASPVTATSPTTGNAPATTAGPAATNEAGSAPAAY
ncbi:MAG: hypothetical protein M1820_001395 [Bogoriella megaspora]|nr:MAG: hypothetical protein M1820_001395 [Bogoriella megaspora]